MSNIKIISQYIKNSSFELFGAPEIFLESRDKPDIALSINIDVKKLGDENYEIALKIGAEATIKEEKFFDSQLTYAGLFAIKEVEGEMLDQILMIYCPNILFPFLRRIITNTTTDAGISPLMIDPIDFATLYSRRKAAANSEPVNDTTN